MINRDITPPTPYRAYAPAAFSIATVLLLAFIVALCWRQIDSSDLLFHLKAGQVIRQTGRVPNIDIFSTASSVEPWAYIEWLWAEILSLVFSAASWTGISLVNVILAAVTAVLLLARGRIHGGRLFESSVVGAFVMAVLLPVFQPGPEMAVLPLFLLALLLAEGRRLWPMVLLSVIGLLWANMHAGYLLPLLVPVGRLFFPPSATRPNLPKGPRAYLLVLILAGIIVVFITPHSYVMIHETWARTVNNIAAFTGDPIKVLTDATFYVRAFAAVALLAIIVASPRRFPGFEIFCTALLALAAFFTSDALNFLLIFLAGPAAGALSLMLVPVWQRRRVRPLAATAIVLVNVATLALTLMAFRLTPATLFRSGLKKHAFPEMAAGRMAAIPLRAAILNPPDVGGYLLWRLWPGWKVCIDNRSTLYSAQFQKEYELLWEGGKHWESLVTLWRVSAILGTNEIMERHSSHNLFYELADSPDWVPVFWDSASILYIKRGVNLTSTNLSPFRQLKPGIPWPVMKSRLRTPDQWREFGADLRLALMDDPTNEVAREFLKRTEAETKKE